MITNRILEVCANSVGSAVHAALAGADRIELCQNLNEGGTTPSAATIKYCTEKLPLRTFVLIRPRAGNFHYRDAEYEIMKEDVRICKEYGAEGIVTGFLREDYSVDTVKIAEIVALAAPMEVTFHRAFDICNDPETALEEIISCGCKRILTSGMSPTALEGREALRRLKDLAGNRISLIAAAGITKTNIKEIALFTGLTEFHASGKKLCKDPSFIENKNYLDPSNEQFRETDIEEIRAILHKLKNEYR